MISGIAHVQIHATVISIDGNAVVLRGAPGSGKSDLALRLIGDGARLVADDRCDLSVDGIVTASPPEEIAGMLEVRGLGIYKLDYQKDAVVGLVVDLVESSKLDRLPEAAVCSDWGTDIPCIKLAPFEASAPDKVRLALRHALGELDSVS